ncbi:MAG TPA: hypothetical protein VMS88_07755 [Terriglobales bacterium]|nr:hypothetical protein [Terriglobales bacterium]
MDRSDRRSLATRSPRGIVVFETAGFLIAAAACWVTEWLDPPFHAQQVIVLSAAILALGTVTVTWTVHALRRIRFLEGFLVICAGCKKVRLGEEWVAIESFLGTTSDLRLSHGMCPHCADLYFGPKTRRSAP